MAIGEDMSDISEVIKREIQSANPAARVEVTEDPAPHNAYIPAHVAANICKMLEQVSVKGPEALAWVEAYQTMLPVARAGAGIPFQGLGK